MIKYVQALKLSGLSKDDISHWEVNEAFSVVALANQKACYGSRL